jgi:hypothetical protein
LADRIRLAILLSVAFHLVSALFFVLIFAGAASIILPCLAGNAPLDYQELIDRAVFGSSVTAIGFAGWALFLAMGGALYAYALRTAIEEIWHSGKETVWKVAWSAIVVLFEVAGLSAYYFVARREIAAETNALKNGGQ